MTTTLTATEDFKNVIEDCKNSSGIEFRKNLRIASIIFGTNEEVRTQANVNEIAALLVSIGYTARDTERWFEALEVQFGLREAVSFDAPALVAA